MTTFKDPKTIEIRPNTTDFAVFQQVFVAGFYQPVLGLRPTYNLIIDGGANCGCTPVWFRNHFPDAEIVAIEPDPENAAVCLRNTENSRVNVLEAALWWRHGRGNIVDVGQGAFALRVEQDEDDRGPIRLIELEPLLTKRPSLVKLDIEGSETVLFRHPAWLDKVDVIAVELHGPEAEDALNTALSRQARRYRRAISGETTIIDFLG